MNACFACEENGQLVQKENESTKLIQEIQIEVVDARQSSRKDDFPKGKNNA